MTPITTTTVCVQDQCGRKTQARGLCNRHYKAAQRRGELPARIPYDMTRAFWARVEKTETCWLWRGGINADGYGQFQPSRERNLRAHKFAWESEHGPTPDGMVLDHLCRTRACVRPEHIEAVTPRTNTLRGIGPAAINSRKTRCKNGHRFTPENTRITNNGRRTCWTCIRGKWAQVLVRQKAKRAATECGSPCKNGPCSQRTTDPSGRCYLHQHQETRNAD